MTAPVPRLLRQRRAGHEGGQDDYAAGVVDCLSHLLPRLTPAAWGGGERRRGAARLRLVK